ncbi:hypothetical protein M9H77_12774 [Catharanthus roseus]|uniref:Uncharacterized protein n=1 Tax=Catharanthus roseus TaxID=4058 RepID=A0ACC0BI98_CATRO|nr:hypothetical protein M9H77_12774 [Catharanthus roseus]
MFCIVFSRRKKILKKLEDQMGAERSKLEDKEDEGDEQMASPFFYFDYGFSDEEDIGGEAIETEMQSFYEACVKKKSEGNDQMAKVEVDSWGQVTQSEEKEKQMAAVEADDGVQLREIEGGGVRGPRKQWLISSDKDATEVSKDPDFKPCK